MTAGPIEGPVNILTCDDHAIFRAGLREALGSLAASLVETSSCDEALAVVAERGDIDLVLLDLNLPGMDGFTGLRTLRSRHPEIAVVIVSASEDPHDVAAALEAGASGFIPKSSPPEVLRGALQLVLTGSLYVPPAVLPALGARSAESPGAAGEARKRQRTGELTGRQREVLHLVSRGLTNKEIASVLKISAATVKVHISAIFDALDVTNRTEATLMMRELGLDADD